MSDLLVSFTIRSRRDDPVGQRVWDNGLVEDYQTWRRVKGENGIHRTEQVTPGWYEITWLNQAQLKAIQDAISTADVAGTPPEIETIVDGYSDISWAEWRVRTPDGLKDIRVLQWGPLDEAAMPLNELLIRITDLVNLAVAGVGDVPE